jgi:putative phosphoesterase
MKLGIISDTHDNTGPVEEALERLKSRGVELVLHCGDIESPDTVRLFAALPTHFVFGNCDGEWQPPDAARRPGRDYSRLRTAIAAVGAEVQEPFGNLELAGKRLAWVHGDDTTLLRSLENSNHFDYLFHGHTHVAREHVVGRTRVINPGALYRVRVRTCLVLDLDTGETDSVVIG